MNTPKNQQELLQIIQEQDKQIRSMRQAIGRLEKKVTQLAILAERTQGVARRNGENTVILESRIQAIQRMLQQ